MKFFAFVIVVAAFIIAANLPGLMKPNETKNWRIENINLVMCGPTEPLIVTVFVPDGDEQVPICLSCNYFVHNGCLTYLTPNTRILADAPKGQPMWADVSAVESGRLFREWKATVVVHVHSVKDLNGSGWVQVIPTGKHNKTVAVETQVIE
jgi:hypothetical protein